MDRHPDGHPAWLDIMDPNRVVAPMTPLAGDPYFPEGYQIVPVDSSDEEDPEEDLEGYQSGDDYVPADVPDFGPDEVEESEPEECLTEEEEEVIIPISPLRPPCQPGVGRGKGPMVGMTSSTSIYTAHRPDLYSFADRPLSDMSRTLPDITPFLTRPTCGQKRKATDDPPRFERGESSRAPPHDDPIPPVLNNRFPIQVRPLEEIIYQTTEQRVEELEKKAKEDSEAIQTLYHRMGASRTEVNHMAMTIRSMEYELEVSQNRQDAAENRAALAEEELRLVRQHQEELGDFVASRLI